MNLNTILDEAIERKASDVHLASGEVPRIRIKGDLVRLDVPPLSRQDLDALLDETVPPEARMRAEAGEPVERSLIYGDFGVAALVFRCGDGGMAATFRIIAGGVPDLDKIAVGGEAVFDLLLEQVRGLALLVGRTGSGKWTAACSLVDAINARRPARIFVIESSANYRFTSKQGLVTQVRVGEDCDSYERALDFLASADLDVLAIDNIPTGEVLRKLLMLAESGHFIIANLHADSVADAFSRLLRAAGPDADGFRQTLSRNLVSVVAQRLARRADGTGRIAVYDWIVSTAAVQEAVRSSPASRLQDLQSTEPGCRSLDAAVQSLISQGLIDREAGAAVEAQEL